MFAFLFLVSIPILPTNLAYAEAPVWDMVNSQQISGTQMQLKWNAVLGATGYKIYRTTDQPGEFQKLIATIQDGTATSYIDSTISELTLYHYEITTIFNGTESELSNPLTVRTLDLSNPNAVTDLSSPLKGGNWVELKWSPPVNTNDLHHFEIYRNNAKVGVLNAAAGTTSYSYRDVGVTGYTGYSYYVVVLDNSGRKSGNSNTVSVTTGTLASASQAPATPIPSPPTSPENTRVNLSWSANSEADFVGYKIFRSTSGDVDANYSFYATSYTNSFVDPDVPTGTTYYYKVVAVDSGAVESARSRAVQFDNPSIAQDVTPPDPVTGLKASSVSATKIVLAWTASASSDTAQYIVWKSNDGLTYTNIGTTNSNTFTVSSNVTELTTYSFRVMAKDTAGNYSAGSNKYTLKTPAADTAKPTTPSNFKADTIGETYVQFTWGPSFDNNQVDRYEIQMLTGGNYVTKTTVQFPKDNGIVDGLTPNTGYTFQIVAYDNSNNPSVPSSPLSVTTLKDASPPGVLLKNPYDGATGIGTGQTILVRFDDAIDPATVTDATFYLTNYADATNTHISGTFDVGNPKEIRFNHSALSPNTLYKVTMTSGIKNISGLSLAQTYVWTFTTGDTQFLKPHGKYTGNTALCGSCHNTHTGTGPKLINQKEVTQVCYTCHDGTGTTAKGSVFNTGQQFGSSPVKASRHPIDAPAAETSVKTSCTDCHNAHDGGIDLDKGNYKHLPRLLTSQGAAGSTAASQGKEFCWNCHGQTASPQNSKGYLTNTYRGDYQTYYPTYKLDTQGNNIYVGHNSAKMDEYKWYNNSTPDRASTGTDLKCDSCHEKHGSDLKPLLRTQIGRGATVPTTTVNKNGKEFCYQCHDQPMETAYSAYITPTQNNAWDGQAVNEARGHAQFDCQVCHNPHGTQYPAYLRLNYKVDTSKWETSYNSQNFTLCYDCHDETKVTKFYVHSKHLSGFGALCKDCHRPHGAIAGENKKYTSPNSGGLNHKIGFPSDRVKPDIYGVKAYSRDAQSPNTGWCWLSCHGETAHNENYSVMRTGMLKSDWQTSSTLLNSRPKEYYNGPNGTQWRDTDNYNGYMWK